MIPTNKDDTAAPAQSDRRRGGNGVAPRDVPAEPAADPAFDRTIMLKDLTAVEVAVAGAQPAARTTKTTATFVGHPAIMGIPHLTGLRCPNFGLGEGSPWDGRAAATMVAGVQA